MPIYRATVTKRWSGPPYDGVTWSNVYHFNIGTVDTALSDAIAAGVLEMVVSWAPVDVIRVHVVNTVDKNDSKTGTPGSSGALDPTGLGGPLPLFNTVRVVFEDTAGRPEQKYLRLAANTHNIENGQWSGELVANTQSDYADPCAALANLCGPTGQDITGATVLPQVQIRQLGWHRRTRPGFHRGWVAN